METRVSLKYFGNAGGQIVHEVPALRNQMDKLITSVNKAGQFFLNGDNRRRGGPS